MKIGSASWKLHYQIKRKPWLLLLPLLSFLMLVVTSCALISGDDGTATTFKVGQAVAEGWNYEGYDSGGNLIFQKEDKVVLLSPESKQLTLGGTHLKVFSHANSSVQVEVLADEDAGWGIPSFLYWLGGGVLVGLLIGRSKKGRGGPVRKPSARVFTRSRHFR
ncbi:MAG TPA: hypothetical protein VFV52_00840 [Bacilli bacterium]|nr:hypothetical protein [Bacilli bacterium]